jgi:hypothetical protein
MQNMSLSEWLRSHSLFAGLPEKTQVQLDGMFHRYLLQSLDANSLRRNIKKIVSDESEAIALYNIRVPIKENANLNTYYKLALLAYLHGDNEPVRILKIRTRYLSNLIRRYQLDHAKIRISKYCPRHQQELFKASESELTSSVKKYVNYKMAFIASSENIELSDLHTEFYMEILIIFRWLYPFRNSSHLIGACKQALHNRVINRIKLHTTQSRSRYVKDSKGLNEARIIPIETIIDGNGFDVEAKPCLLKDGTSVSWSTLYHLNSVQSFRDTLTPKHKMAFDLMNTLSPPEDFVSFLESKL